MARRNKLTAAERSAHKKATLQAIRGRWMRIDYYPSADAAKAIKRLADEGTSVTDAVNTLVEAGAASAINALPEFYRRYC